MKAIFEVEFDPEQMVDEDTLDKDFDGDWFKFMKWLYDSEDMGIFDKRPELVEIDHEGES